MGSTFRMRFKSVKHNKSLNHNMGHNFLKITLFSIPQRPHSMILHNIYVIFIHITH